MTGPARITAGRTEGLGMGLRRGLGGVQDDRTRFYGCGHRGRDITKGTGQLRGQTVAELLALATALAMEGSGCSNFRVLPNRGRYNGVS